MRQRKRRRELWKIALREEREKSEDYEEWRG